MGKIVADRPWTSPMERPLEIRQDIFGPKDPESKIQSMGVLPSLFFIFLTIFIHTSLTLQSLESGILMKRRDRGDVE